MSNMYDEFKRKIIEKVRSVPAIWDKNDVQYRNKGVLQKHWKQISSEVGIKEVKVKRVWRTLRQQFRNQAKKIQITGQEALDTANPQWPYYHGLLFLKDQLDLEESSSIGVEQDVEVIDEYDDLQDYSDYELEEMNEAMVSDIMLSDVFPQHEDLSHSKLRKRKADYEPTISSSPVISEANHNSENGHYSGYRKIMKPANGKESSQSVLNAKSLRMQGERQTFIEKNTHEESDEFFNTQTWLEHKSMRMQQQRQPTTENNDEDTGFFNSLLPHVRQLQPQQKMTFRLRIQHQLYELLYGPYDPHQSLRYLSNFNSAVVPFTDGYSANKQQSYPVS